METVYLFNEECAKRNGWARDDTTLRCMGGFALVGKVFLYVIVMLGAIFIPEVGIFISGIMGEGLFLFIIYMVIKHLKRNDVSLCAEYTAFIEKDNSLYYVKYNAPDIHYVTEELRIALCRPEFFMRILNLALRHQDRFQNALMQLEFPLTDLEIPEHEVSFGAYSIFHVFKKCDVKAKSAVIIRLDEVSVKAAEGGLVSLKYKDRNKRWKTVKVANGYEGLKNDIEINKFVQDSRYLAPFPCVKPKLHPLLIGLLVVFGVIILLRVPSFIKAAKFENEAKQKFEQVESIEDLITEEMVLEVLSSREDISFVYEDSSLSINKQGGYTVNISGHDDNTGKQVLITFNEIDTGTGFQMQCTDKWNAYLWISKN